MNKPIFQPTVLMRPVVIWIAMLLLAATLMGNWYLSQASDPYIQEVLSLPSHLSQGKAIFQVNCGVCHGLNGQGDIGPNLKNVSQRKSRIQLIQQVIGGKTPPMPQFQPNTQDMADLLVYLENL